MLMDLSTFVFTLIPKSHLMTGFEAVDNYEKINSADAFVSKQCAMHNAQLSPLQG
jgi:hypothetical protein